MVWNTDPEFLNNENANLCNFFAFRHSSRTWHSPWTNGFIEVRNRFLANLFSDFLQIFNYFWSSEAMFFAYTTNTKPLALLSLLLYKNVFLSKHCITSAFRLMIKALAIQKLITSLESFSVWKIYFRPFFSPSFVEIFHRTDWILDAETTMLGIYYATSPKNENHVNPWKFSLVVSVMNFYIKPTPS